MLRPALLMAVLAGCAAPASPPPEPTTCVPRLTVRTFPDGETLAEVPLDDHGRFALSFIHSVSLTPVRDEYLLGPDGAIRQTAEIFVAHGQGLPSAADEPGALAWEHEDGRFRLTMDRPIPRLVVRTNDRYENRLHADGRTLDLTRWGNRALDLHPEPCPTSRRPAAGR